ncbi:LOW QUALITY PROTEIN: CoA transferase, partial [Achromobacter xylosoxidans C54]
ARAGPDPHPGRPRRHPLPRRLWRRRAAHRSARLGRARHRARSRAGQALRAPGPQVRRGPGHAGTPAGRSRRADPRLPRRRPGAPGPGRRAPPPAEPDTGGRVARRLWLERPLAGAPRLRQPGADEHRHRRGRHARQRRRPSGAAAVPGARPRHRLSDGGRGDPRADRTACDGRRRQHARVVGPQRAVADHAWRHAGRRAGAGPGKRSGLVHGDRGNVMGPGPARQAAHVDRRHARVVGLPGERVGLIRSGLAGRGAI